MRLKILVACSEYQILLFLATSIAFPNLVMQCRELVIFEVASDDLELQFLNLVCLIILVEALLFRPNYQILLFLTTLGLNRV